tara:strand:+ start:220 stop:1107 length:888 start_codon:yes stop_codon:yes gene_type:complete
MEHNIKHILNKKEVSGEEIGKLCVLKRIHRILHKESLLSHEEEELLRQKLDELKTSPEWKKYEIYQAVSSWISHYSQVVQVADQQATSGYTRLYFRITYSMQAEDVLFQFDNFPQILTQKQHQEGLYVDSKDRPMAILSEESFDNQSTDQILKMHEVAYKGVQEMSVFSRMNNPNEIKFLSAGVKFVEHGLKTMEEFNTIVYLLADFLDMPSFSQAHRMNTDDFYEMILKLNKELILLTSQVEKSQKKLQFIKDNFPFFILENYKIPPKKIKLAKEKLYSYLESDNPYDILDILR